MTAPDDVDFRPLTEADLPLLHAWLQRPHVAARWGEAEPVEALREDFLVDTGPLATRAFIAMHQGRAFAFVQVYVVMASGEGWWPDETDPGARGVDQFLAEEADLGRGLGRAMLRALLRRLFDDPAVSAVQTDPSPDNLRAIRCCAAAGFEPVRLLDTPDGRALLMRATRASLRLRGSQSLP